MGLLRGGCCVTDLGDIVARLRKEAFICQLGKMPQRARLCDEAVAEIQRLRRDYSCISSELRRMMEERDAARREVCEIYADTYGSVGLVAERRGWDCFKEESR